MRHVATAIESFRGDHEQYPESTTDPSRVVCQLAAADERPVSTFAVDHLGKNPLHLTTPVGYLATYWPDPCATQRAGKPVVTFGYYTPDPKAKDSGWILFSPGPDGKFDLDWTKYDPKKGVDQTDLYNDTFDPTNGTVSHGDIWRVKQ